MIEDDAGHARLIERNIRRAGVTNELVHFANAASARGYFDGLRKRPDSAKPILVLLDLNLPDVWEPISLNISRRTAISNGRR